MSCEPSTKRRRLAPTRRERQSVCAISAQYCRPEARSVSERDARLRRVNERDARLNRAFIRRLPAPVDMLLSRRIALPVSHNVVVGASMGVDIDALHVASHCPNGEYKPRRFGPVMIRSTGPSATVLLFPTGKVVEVGGRSIWCARVAVQRVRALLEVLGYHTNLQDFCLENNVCNVVVGHGLSLEKLHMHPRFNATATYEPEIFPGLIYDRHPDVGGVVALLIFDTGKIVLTGLSDEATGAKIYLDLKPYLTEVRCKVSSNSHRRFADRIQRKLDAVTGAARALKLRTSLASGGRVSSTFDRGTSGTVASSIAEIACRKRAATQLQAPPASSSSAKTFLRLRAACSLAGATAAATRDAHTPPASIVATRRRRKRRAPVVPLVVAPPTKRPRRPSGRTPFEMLTVR